MKTIIITFSLSLVYLCSCGRKIEVSSTRPDNIIIQKNDSNNLIMKEKLKQQLQKGVSGVYDNTFDINTYDFTEKDLLIIIPFLDDVLKKNGYLKPTQDEFKYLINEYFNRTLDYNIDSKYISVYFDFYNKCNRNIHFHRNTNNIELYSPIYYVLKNELFITPLFSIPEIIDYKMLYPEEAEYELNMPNSYYDNNNDKIVINKWRDLDNLSSERKHNINTLIHRNKFLFNNNQASFTWLINNDIFFLEELVKTFGYVKNEKLLKLIIDENRFNNKNGITNGFEYGKILWTKNCSQKLTFHTETLSLMGKTLKQDYPNYLDDLLEYVEYLEDNPDKKLLLDFSEKALIIANILYFVESMAREEEYARFQFKAMGRFYKFHDHEGLYDKEFKANNYYNLKDFQYLWEEAKEHGDGTTYYSYIE